mgnify:CR=1 FL=1
MKNKNKSNRLLYLISLVVLLLLAFILLPQAGELANQTAKTQYDINKPYAQPAAPKQASNGLGAVSQYLAGQGAGPGSMNQFQEALNAATKWAPSADAAKMYGGSIDTNEMVAIIGDYARNKGMSPLETAQLVKAAQAYFGLG